MAESLLHLEIRTLPAARCTCADPQRTDRLRRWADELSASTADSPAAAGQCTGRIHLAFQAGDRAAVDAFHRAGLAAGGSDHGPPGLRPYHGSCYAAFLLDPDGNNVPSILRERV